MNAQVKEKPATNKVTTSSTKINKQTKRKAKLEAQPENLSHSVADIIPRKPVFKNFDKLPKNWAMGNPLATTIMGVFSMVIPEGEKFFIRTVNTSGKGIDDEKLQQDIRNFTKQEAYHANYHVKFNDALRQYGFDVDRFAEDTKVGLGLVEKYLPKNVALSVTVFLEHLTALAAELSFHFPEISEDWDPQAKEFWQWHAIEEMEHKSVAYDVFNAAGGSYLTRVATASTIISLASLLPIVFALQAIGFNKTAGAEEIKTFKEFREKHPGLGLKVGKFAAGFMLDYFKPDYHPWDLDHTDYIEQWKKENKAVA